MKFSTKIRCGVLFGCCCLMLSCSNNNSTEPERGSTFSLISNHPLTISEPSGLTMNESGTALWTVGSKPQRIYKLDLNGNTLDKLPFKGDDLEGIAYDPSDSTLWVVEEASREVVHLDLTGNVLSRQQLNLTGEKKSGLEGICFDDAGNIYVLNEKIPGLFIELNRDLSIKTQRTLSFADDYSGLAFHSGQNGFWVLSDQEKKLYLWSMQAGVSSEYPLSFPKAEGIAFNEAANRVYVVSDSLNMLYIYQIQNP